MFTFLACLLDVSTPIKHRFNGHNDPHYGRFGGLRLETEAGAILSFEWISHKYSLPQPDTALGRSLKHAALVLLGGHASYPFELWPQSLAQLHAAVRNCTANATVALIEPFPAHFPSFREHRNANGTAPEIPPGEFDKRINRNPSRRWFECTTHRNDTSKSDNKFVTVVHQYAAEHHMPVFQVWRDAVANHDDHPHLDVPGSSSTDCRHYCNPGRTIFALSRRLPAFIRSFEATGRVFEAAKWRFLGG